MKTFRREYVKPAPRPLSGVPYMYQIEELLNRVVPGYRIKDHEGRGLYITIGEYTLSVQWSGANCCTNHLRFKAHSPAPICRDFEIAVWETRTNKWVKLGENDDVLGYVTWDKFETILNLVKLKHFDDIRVAAYDEEVIK